MDTYHYELNLQGDVIAILDSAGTRVVEYTYDAWGNILDISGSMKDTLGEANPLRYRGYVYDSETGMYYCQSRYYDPKTHRFLNADVVYDTDAGLQGFNLYVYCGNDPLNRIDISGADSIDMIDGDKEDDPELEGGAPGNGKPSGGSIGGTNYSSIGYIETGGLNTVNNTGGNYFTFKSQGALIDHYERHNPEMGNKYLSAQEYEMAANEVIQYGTYLPEYNAYVEFYNYWGGCNYLFVGMTHDGLHITTFHIRNAHKIWE